jgi:two-component system sensor histidine kinase/response regulator
VTKILVIDDDPILRGAVTEWLGVEGFEVLSAEDGIVGVKYAYDNVPNLILCDTSVPHLDGYGVLLEIRANPATSNTPIIFTGTKKSEKKFHPSLSFDADEFIPKPFTQSELLQAIHTRLQKKSLEQLELERQVAQLEQALASQEEQRLLKAKMIAMVVHDFRNPLASILSSSNLVRDYVDRMDEQRRLTHMNRIDASVRYLISMLDEMLVLAQIDSGSLVFSPVSLDPGFLLQQIVEEFQLIHINSHKISFENSLEVQVIADPRLLRQIVSNLISNAVKYSPSGGVVHVTLDNNHQQLILKVIDHGIGISDVDQASFLDAFHRGSNVGNIPGTGLGLTIVKRAVELCQGDIQVESQIGSGTTMTVILPMTEAGTSQSLSIA